MIEQITLNNKTYKIEVVDQIPDENKDTLGRFDSETRTIYLRKHNEKEMVATLLHEIYHGILYNTGIHNLLDAEKEELFCDSFANGVSEIFNNKELVKLIKDKT